MRQTDAPPSLFVVTPHGTEVRGRAKSTETHSRLRPKSPYVKPLLPGEYDIEDEGVLPSPHPAEDAADLFSRDAERILPSTRFDDNEDNTSRRRAVPETVPTTLSPPGGSTGLASLDGGSWAASATLAAREVRKLSEDPLRGEKQEQGPTSSDLVRISPGYFASSPSCRAAGGQEQEAAVQTLSDTAAHGKEYRSSRRGRSASFDEGGLSTWPGCAGGGGEPGERETSGSSRGERGTRMCTESTVGTVTTTETGAGTGPGEFLGGEEGENFPTVEEVTCRGDEEEEDDRETSTGARSGGDAEGQGGDGAAKKKNQVKLER